MHELAVAYALVEQVEMLIHQNQAQRATHIYLRIGPLSGIVPELLSDAISIVAASSRMAGAELEMTRTSIRIYCQVCEAEDEVEINRLLCPSCGNWHTKMISGDELLLERIELEGDD
ncbi:Hydrogenase maturation factor HypA [Gammaproteobacteria bacterium]